MTKTCHSDPFLYENTGFISIFNAFFKYTHKVADINISLSIIYEKYIKSTCEPIVKYKVLLTI